jgi:hypothetical protein
MEKELRHLRYKAKEAEAALERARTTELELQELKSRSSDQRPRTPQTPNTHEKVDILGNKRFFTLLIKCRG